MGNGAQLQGEASALVARSWDELARLALVPELPEAALRPWLVFTLKSGDDPAEPRFVLVPEDRQAPTGFGIEPERVRFQQSTVVIADQARLVADRRRASSLVSALPLQPVVLTAPPDRLLATFTTPAEVARAIHSASMLHATNLRVGHVQPLEGKPRILLMMTSPSVFLIERWQERGVPLFRPMASTGYWVEMGSRHPWEAFGGLEPRTDLTLIGARGWVRISETAFSDAYQFVDLGRDGDSTTWSDSDSTTRFEVPLRWGRQPNHVPAELWLLGEEELLRLERLLGVLSHADLENLQLGTLDGDGDAAVYVVREALTGRSRQHLDFGRGFAPVPGIPNLLIPTDRVLDPPVPRDLLVRLFDVRPRTITLVIPSPDDAMDVVSFPEPAFKSVAGLVDHRIRGAQRVLEAILARTALDLGALAKVPARPTTPVEGPRARTVRPPSQEPSAPAEEPDDPLPSTPTTVVTPEPGANSPVFHDVEPPPVPVPRNEELDEAERLAVEALEGVEVWIDLAELKLRAGDIEEGIRCFEHATWINGWGLVPPPPFYEDALLSSDDIRIEVRRDVLRFVDDCAQGETPDAQQLAGVIQSLRTLESSLPKKARWLLWKALLEVNPDRVEAARVREALLGELARRGVDERDSFVFVRRQVRGAFQQHTLPAEVRVLLDRMEKWAGDIQADHLRIESLAAISMAREAAGDEVAVNRFLEAEKSTIAGLPDTRGAGALAMVGAACARAGHVESEKFYETALSHLSNMRDGYEKDLVIVDVLSRIHLGTLLGAERGLVEGLLGVLASQQPTRRCLQLADCADLLLDLGAAVEVSEMVDALLDDPGVQADALYLQHALEALVTCQAGRPPSRTLALKALEIALAIPADSDACAEAVDIALSGCGEEQLELVRAAIEPTPSLASMLLDTCLVRGYALFGRVDAGLALLEERLESVWLLRDPRAISIVLRRLVDNTAQLGRPADGLRLIEKVLTRLHAHDLGSQETRKVLSTCAVAVGRLGAQDRAFELLEKLVDTFEALIRGQTQGVSFLFELLGQIVDQILSLGETDRGIELAIRAASSVSARVDGAFGTDHPYFVHQARIKCAIALLSTGELDRGFALLEESAADISRVRMFDGRDRVDLCADAVKALTLVPIDSRARTDLLEVLVETGVGSDDGRSGSSVDTFRRDMICRTINELIQRQSAHRLALQKYRAHEERLIRRRILDEELA